MNKYKVFFTTIFLIITVLLFSGMVISKPIETSDNVIISEYDFWELNESNDSSVFSEIEKNMYDSYTDSDFDLDNYRIDDIVPIELLEKTGQYSYLGKEYGFFIQTYYEGIFDNKLVSLVFIYDISASNFSDEDSLDKASLIITPLFEKKYLVTEDEIVFIEDTNNFFIANIEIRLEVINPESLGSENETYSTDEADLHLVKADYFYSFNNKSSSSYNKYEVNDSYTSDFNSGRYICSTYKENDPDKLIYESSYGLQFRTSTYATLEIYGYLNRDVIFLQSAECNQEGYKTILFDKDDYIGADFIFVNTSDTDDLFRYSIRLDIINYSNESKLYSGHLGNYQYVDSTFGQYVYSSSK